MELFINIFIALAAGGLSTLLTSGNMNIYATLTQPPLSPPGWVFPVVWTVLYILMGAAAYLVQKEPYSDAQGKAMRSYYIQLVLNFFWPLLFFKLRLFLFSFIWLLALIIAIIITIRRFAAVSRAAARLLVPYLLWCLFAAYLNFGIYVLN